MRRGTARYYLKELKGAKADFNDILREEPTNANA
jgi:predicted transcriptional regulator